ncbi:MAG: tRNA guanosine(34) transglycosylase Tgt [Planctomycetota bacterium]|nr:tRNA guanosine(34) transglycosylase Tgt [Planctomycetota bacterium]
MSALRFEIFARSGARRARRGRVTTRHGSFDTPAFMPVGTRASVKGIVPDWVSRTGAQILLANTYHLLLRPGSDLVARRGGLHRFMNWDAPILTDSGGYQAYSMADVNRVDDDGVTFKSIIDGSMVRLTPERATHVQNELGADIIMAFDDCPPAQGADDADAPDARLSRVLRRDRVAPGADFQKRLDIANERTLRWLERCKASHARADEQSLFGIVQGGTDEARRAWCAERVTQIDLPGYAIGGVAVGEPPDEIARVVRATAPLLPLDRPRYLMGVGYERDLLNAVLAGVDMFDCVLPTRNGRNANAFTPAGQIRLRNQQFAEDDGPIDPGCDCPACRPSAHGWKTPDARPFTRAYLRHLFMAGEMLGPILVSLHNLRHFQRFMSDVREAIPTDDWAALLARWPAARGAIVAP